MTKSYPTCLISQKAIAPGQPCIMLLLAMAPLPRWRAGETLAPLLTWLPASPPLAGVYDGDGWLTQVPEDAVRDLSLFLVGGSGWETAGELHRTSGLAVADGGFVSWRAEPATIATAFVRLEPWQAVTRIAYPGDAEALTRTSRETTNYLLSPDGPSAVIPRWNKSPERCEHRQYWNLSKRSVAATATVVFDYLHPNARTALLHYIALSQQAKKPKEIGVAQIADRLAELKVFTDGVRRLGRHYLPAWSVEAMAHDA